MLATRPFASGRVASALRTLPVPPVRWPQCRLSTAWLSRNRQLCNFFRNFYRLRVDILQIFSVQVYVWPLWTIKGFIKIDTPVFPKSGTQTDRGGNFIYIDAELHQSSVAHHLPTKFGLNVSNNPWDTSYTSQLVLKFIVAALQHATAYYT